MQAEGQRDTSDAVMRICAADALAQAGPRADVTPAVQHDLVRAYLAVVMSARDDGDSRVSSGAKHAVENPPPGMDDVRPETAHKSGEGTSEGRIRYRREEQMGRCGMGARQMCQCHRKTMHLDAVNVLTIGSLRVAGGRHGDHPPSAHLCARQRRDRQFQTSDVRQEAIRGVQDPQPAQPVSPGYRPFCHRHPTHARRVRAPPWPA